MPHQPTAPPGIPFFARIDRFHCECPNCTTMIVAHKDPTLSGAILERLKHGRTLYNPISSVLCCPKCRRTFGVGLLLWSIAPGGQRGFAPADHQPTRRQLAALAKYSYGIWVAEPKRQGEPFNVAVDGECTCPREAGGWRPSCPVHGWEAFEAGQAALDQEPPPDEG
jgi:hypothetical protein